MPASVIAFTPTQDMIASGVLFAPEAIIAVMGRYVTVRVRAAWQRELGRRGC